MKAIRIFGIFAADILLQLLLVSLDVLVLAFESIYPRAGNSLRGAVIKHRW